MNSYEQFSAWVKRVYPEVWKAARENPGLGFSDSFVGPVMPPSVAVKRGYMTQGTTPGNKSWADKLLDVGKTVLQFDMQRKLLDLQYQRAKRGQPPLDPSYVTPAVRAQVGVDPALYQQLKDDTARAVGTGLKQMAVPLGALAIALVMSRKKGR